MVMNSDEVTRISRDVAREYDGALEVVGVTIVGCHRDPCVLMLNLSRAEHHAFENELRSKFREALAAHTATRPPRPD